MGADPPDQSYEVIAMKIALAALGFVNNDSLHNQRVILNSIAQYASSADMLLFGEAFLQGFYAPVFDYEQDQHTALVLHDPLIQEIRSAARKHNIAVSFGFIEKDGDAIYSSQLTLGKDGGILDHFRRVSPGWKELIADDRYREGSGFHTFSFCGKRLSVALCGDLWHDEHVQSMRALSPDTVLWPVYTDFHPDVWNTTLKLEYAEQAQRFCKGVLYVNPYCLDKQDDPDIAKGGSAHFCSGSIASEAPAGQESVLLVELA